MLQHDAPCYYWRNRIWVTVLSRLSIDSAFNLFIARAAAKYLHSYPNLPKLHRCHFLYIYLRKPSSPRSQRITFAFRAEEAMMAMPATAGEPRPLKWGFHPFCVLVVQTLSGTGIFSCVSEH
jgi:hypothetical protein